VIATGGADCWGSNHFGQLGDGSYEDWHTPIEVIGFGDQRTIVVSKPGGHNPGVGTVTSTPLGIDCGNVCQHAFAAGAMVTLTATADPSSYFAGWSGDCSGTGTCVLSMSADHSVSAIFYFGAPTPPPPPPPAKPPCKVPNVVGKTLARARARIVRAHCRVGRVARVSSSARKKNHVLGQNPRAGRRFPNGRRVSLRVGKGRRK
jgi:hypothetical protein